MQDLAGKKIILGLTGGIACYKSAELLRRLQDHGATVEVVMTKAATSFITPTTMQALSGNHVWLETLDADMPNSMAHINLSRQADAIIIAPASADFIAQLANGLAGDLLSTLCLARGSTPLLVAPAMNKEMWANPATQRNIAQLQQDNIALIGPGVGFQACGENGSGRMQEPSEILQELIYFFQPKLLKNKKILITAGPTSEIIDPVRVITNRSSGRMGYSIAQAAAEAGAQVNLVSGPTELDCPLAVNRINVQSAKQMHTEVMQLATQADIFIAVAAVADWGVANPSATKLKKTADNDPPVINFVQNPDILAAVANLESAPWCIGFAAETNDLAKHAKSKRVRKGVQAIVGNLVQNSMGTLDTELVIYTEKETLELKRQNKLSSARDLIKWIAANHQG